MPTARRQVALTPNSVARVHRAAADAGPDPDFIRNTAEDHAAAEERIGTARGWHRSFRLRLRSWRGTGEVPGVMMVTDRGGQCKGVAYRLAGHTVEVTRPSEGNLDAVT